MFLAIINDSYTEVKADLEGSKNDFELGSYFKDGMDKVMTKLHVKKEKIKDIQDILNDEAIAEDGIDYEEWRTELKVSFF
jgi:hypothetical protein